MGQCRGRKLTRRLQLLGIGEMTVRGELPPRRYPWAFDNGAYRDFTAEKPFDAEAFASDLEWAACLPEPDFVVAPDIVGGGAESLACSLEWAPRLSRWRLFLAVQDGMTEAEVEQAARWFDGLFIGGTLEWKRRTMHIWCDLAHRLGKPCHVGRCGSRLAVELAIMAGADSIDSALPLWSEGNMELFLRGLDVEQRQHRLFPAS